MALMEMMANPNINMTCVKSNSNAILDSPNDNFLFYMKIVYAWTHAFHAFCVENNNLIISSLAILVLVYLIYKIYWDPVCYSKELTQVGFEHIPVTVDRQRRIEQAMASRSVGIKLPPPYPNGWFAIAESRELSKGGVMTVDALGQNFCVYRGEDGVARVIDAYCPHLGANLGVGGRVRGNCIECPFHKWKFDASGTCIEVPGVDAPRGVSVRRWTSAEGMGAVWVWHDAEGRPPLWGPPEEHNCSFYGANHFVVAAHAQEIPENGADVAHLNAVHSLSLLTALGEKYPVLHKFIGRHEWVACWKNNEDHTASITLTHDYKIYKFNFFHTEINITQIGPGYVRMHLKTPIGRFIIAQSVTPLGPLLQKVSHRVFCSAYNAPVAPLIVFMESKMFERDIVIWNSKRFVSSPTYSKSDRTIKGFRTWYSQFFSENSISYREAVQNPLDW